MKIIDSIPTSLLLGLFTGIFFSMIDSVLFLFSEKELEHYLMEKIPFLERDELILLLSAGCAAVAIFIANYIEHHITQKYELVKHPFLDALGIIIGVFLVIGIYELYRRNLRNYNTNDNDN